MALDKDRIHELVEIFYQKPPFKTFYVNSNDGESFVKALGVFVSLGITTSMKILEDLRDILGKTPGLKSRIVEIKSYKIAGTFMNQVTSDDPHQYEVDPESVAPNVVLSEAEATKELKELEESGKREEASKLKEAILRVNEAPDPWISRQVMRLENGGYRVFHKYVNYKKEDDTEYRIGIYVEEST